MHKAIILFCTLYGAIKGSVIKPQYDWNEIEDFQFSDQYFPRAEFEDAHLSFVPLAQKYGYPVEDYYITTSDGYILNIQRIPHGKNGPPTESKGVVFLQHGILASSVDWIIAGPEQGFGYILADKGYDVWFGNSRGNKYCKNHTTYSLESKEFWDFSFHEIGTIDLPAMIDFALEKSGEQKLTYIAHSQGTTAFFVMCSQLPDYNAKIRGQFSLAPIAYMQHMTSPLLKFIAFFDKGIGALLNILGVHEFLPNDGFIHNIAKLFCHDTLLKPLCANTLFVMCGFNREHLNMTLLPIVMEQVPAGSSTKQFLHFGQLINSGSIITKGHFSMYDYGRRGNLQRYGQRTPPDYDLSKVTAPVYLFYSGNDWLSHPRDVRRLRDGLGNCKHEFLVPAKNFNHLDYVFGIDAKNLVYDKVMSLMVRLPK